MHYKIKSPLQKYSVIVIELLGLLWIANFRLFFKIYFVSPVLTSFWNHITLFWEIKFSHRIYILCFALVKEYQQIFLQLFSKLNFKETLFQCLHRKGKRFKPPNPKTFGRVWKWSRHNTLCWASYGGYRKKQIYSEMSRCQG